MTKISNGKNHKKKYLDEENNSPKILAKISNEKNDKNFYRCELCGQHDYTLFNKIGHLLNRHFKEKFSVKLCFHGFLLFTGVLRSLYSS